MSMNIRPEAQDLLERVSNFLESEVAPNEAKFHEQIKTDEDRWNYFPEILSSYTVTFFSSPPCWHP